MQEKMNSSEAAETLVKITLEGLEFTLRMSGAAASYLAPVILAKLQEKTDSPGKTKLKNLIKSQKPLKIFSVKEHNIAEFRKQAKRYGVQYAELKNTKKDKDDIVDIIVKAEDAARINRIVERFKLADYDETEVRNEITNDSKEMTDIEKVNENPEALVNDIFSDSKKENNESPLLEEVKEKKNRLESSYPDKNNQTSTSLTDKSSVREELKKIKEEQEKTADLEQHEPIKIKKQEIKHEQPKIKKKIRKGKQR